MDFRLAFLIPLLFFHHNHAKSMLITKTQSSIDPTRVTPLSWSPRAYLYKGFLTDHECDHLINLARDELMQSMVANADGDIVVSQDRTSSGMALDRDQDEIVSRIEQRIAAWTFLPTENGEPIQVLRYKLGEKYTPHFDYFHHSVKLSFGGYRVATVLMYMSNVVKGGETVFPDATGVEQAKNDSWSECAKKGYAVKPSKGDALLFFGLHSNATSDERSLHGSCPVIEGEKWSATKWIRVSPFDDNKLHLGTEETVLITTQSAPSGPLRASG